MLLVETNCFLLDVKNVILEDRRKGVMKLEGVFQRANEVNANGRKYPKAILQREVDKLMPAVRENRLLGELDHPESAEVKLANAAHMITGLRWQGNDLIGECTLLNTTAGLTAQTLIRDGVKLGMSSRGMGTLTDIGESVKEVNDDYDMRTFDLVADPSTRGAFPGLTEGKGYINEARAMVRSAIKKATAEKTMLVLIKEALKDKFPSAKEIVNESVKVSELTMPGEGGKLAVVKRALARRKAGRTPKKKAFTPKETPKAKGGAVGEGLTTGGDPRATSARVQRSLAQNPSADRGRKASSIARRVMKRNPKKDTLMKWRQGAHDALKKVGPEKQKARARFGEARKAVTEKIKNLSLRK